MKALVPIADGTEEMEAVVVIDVMRRAGWTVVVASIHGATVTCHPSVKSQIRDATLVDSPVVTDRCIVTSQGAGTAMDLAFTLVEMHAGTEARKRVADGMAAFSSRAAGLRPE